MMLDKHPIHTTLSTEAMRILERYEKEMGCKNVVLEKALHGMCKDTLKSIESNAIISKLEIEVINPLLGKITEGTILGIIGPPMSGKTLLACAMLDNFLSHNERHCIFASSRNKLSYLVPVTNSLGMALGNFADRMFLDLCEINTLDGLFRTLQKSKPKIIVIDSLEIIQENGSDDLGMIFNSSGWKILSEEVKNQKAICVLNSENEAISRFCDIAIKLHKSKNEGNPTFVKVVKNIGLIPSGIFRLAMNGKVRIVPLLEIEETKVSQEQEKPGSHESLKKIAHRITEPADNKNNKNYNPETQVIEPVIVYAKETKQTVEAKLTGEKLNDEQKSAMAKVGINLNSINILRVVILNPGITQIEIARKLKISQPIVSKILNGFIEDEVLEKDNTVGRKIPINPNGKKIELALGSLIKTGLLPTLTGDTPICEKPAEKTQNQNLREIATNTTEAEIAKRAVKTILAKSVKIASLEELAETLKSDSATIKKALMLYKNNGGKNIIKIEETEKNCMIYAL